MENEETKYMDSLLSAIEKKGRTARLFSLLLTGISVLSIIVAGVILYNLISAISEKRAELKKVQNEAEFYKDQAVAYKANTDALKAKQESLIVIFQNDEMSQQEQNKDAQTLLGATPVGTTSPTPARSPTPTTSPTQSNSPIIKPSPIPVLTPQPSKIRGKVYIQIVDPAHRERANEIKRILRSNGFNALGVDLIEKLRGKIPKTLVKYFHQDDKDDAEQLAALLRKQNIYNDVKTDYIPLPAEIGQLEIWFSNNAL